MKYLLREHDAEKFAAQKRKVEEIGRKLNENGEAVS